MADPALEQDIRGLLAETFHVEPSAIEAEAQLGEFPQWDSMAHMDLMLGLETRFGVEITAETISQLTSLPAILEYLRARTK